MGSDEHVDISHDGGIRGHVRYRMPGLVAKDRLEPGLEHRSDCPDVDSSRVQHRLGLQPAQVLTLRVRLDGPCLRLVVAHPFGPAFRRILGTLPKLGIGEIPLSD